MTIHLSDLGPAARAQAEAKLSGSPDVQSEPKGKRKRPKGGTAVFDGVCFVCKLRITGAKAMERHSEETGHRRFECWPLPTLAGDTTP